MAKQTSSVSSSCKPMLKSSNTQVGSCSYRTAIAQAAKQQLFKRTSLIYAAVLLLARLKLAQRNQAFKLAISSPSRSAELKVAMTYLLDEDALQCLLNELEAALEASKVTMEPHAYRQAVMVHQRAAELLEQEVIPVLSQRI